jgi:carboxyl-terminal processing protease
MKLSGYKHRILVVFLIGVITFSFIQTKNLFEVTKNLEIFTSVYKEVHLNYVEELNPGEMMKTGIDAMLSSLDPYTNFYTESQAEDALIKRKGDFGTPGIEVELLQNNIVVTRVESSSSAENVGVKLGDILLEINEKSFVGKPISEVYEAFEGSVGSKLNVKFLRNGIELYLNLERRKLSFDNVPFYGIIPNTQTGYIKLDQFMENSASEVREAFVDLKKQNIKSLILDLRNNGGGLLVDAVRIVNLFVPKNILIVYNKGKNDDSYRAFNTMEDPIDTQIPLVVLINENSASASEIVSGAIQDLDRGVIIGRNSFGKGLVQNVLPLPYRHQMKVTVAKYYIPSGRCVQAKDYSKQKNENLKEEQAYFTKNKRKVFEGAGIKPDILVEDFPENEFMKALKAQSVVFEYVASVQLPEEQSVAEDFRLSEFWFNNLKDFAKNKNFTYESLTEKKLKEIQITSQKESYNLASTKFLDEIKLAIEKEKTQDWNRYKDYLEKMLAAEFARKMYGEKSKYLALFKYDNDIRKALDVISDSKVYNKILLP